jgi:hypothetical protein
MRFNKGGIAVGNGTSAGVEGNGLSACSNASIFVVPPGGAVQPFYIEGNAFAGISAGLSANIAFYGGSATGNYYDIYANTNATVYTHGSSYSSYTPSPYNTQGNIGAYIGWGPTVPITFV